MRNILLICFLITTPILGNAQSYHKIDSIKQLLVTKNDSLKIRNYLLIEREYRNNNIDTALFYSKLALNLLNKKQLICMNAEVYNSLATDYKLMGDIKLAQFYFEKSLNLAIEQNDSANISSLYNNLAVLFADFGKYKKALDYNMKSLQISEACSNTDNKANSYNNVGLVYYYIGDYDKALEYYNKSLEIRNKQHDKLKIALLYNNIGIVYYFKKETNKTFNYFHKALKIWRSVNDLRQMSLTLSNLGELYMELGNLNEALENILQSDELNENLKDKYSMVYSKSLLGDIYYKRKRYFEAKKYYEDALKIAKDIHANQSIHDMYEKMSDTYSKTGDIDNAFKFYKLKSEIKDSILNIEKQKAIQEIQTKYETKKKEQQIELLNNKNKLSEALLRNQKIIIFSLIFGLLLVFITVFIIIRRNIERRKANELLAKKNDEIALQKEELTSSIVYAKRIQTAMLPNNQIIDNSLADYFILFKPKDVVSGDFFWWTHFDKYTIITVADCTGHGVPGAFMSILGVSYLREIVSKEKVIYPGSILNRLREEIIISLNQQGKPQEQKDGMDMSIICINHEKNILQFAGANNPLYILSKMDIEINDHSNNAVVKNELSEQKTEGNIKLFEIKPDKMPVSIYFKMQPFTTSDIQLHKGDQIYLFSDGYADQFGGLKNKKFKYKAFKELLLKNATKPMNEQEKILESTFHNWKKNNDQIDDITILGITL